MYIRKCSLLIISRTLLAPHRGITMLLIVFPMLRFPPPWLFCNYWSVLVDPFTFYSRSLPQPPSLLTAISLSSGSMSLFLCHLSDLTLNVSSSDKAYLWSKALWLPFRQLHFWLRMSKVISLYFYVYSFMYFFCCLCLWGDSSGKVI